MSNNFNLDSYGVMISRIKELGYKIVFFEEIDFKSKHLILRHDIDMSLKSALNMAVYEASQEIYSTYFLLLRSDMYNIFSSESTDIVKKIISLGHKIGLHFDHSIYTYKEHGFLDQYCEDECSALESWFNININIISFHKPSKNLLSIDRKIAGRINTYQSNYFKKILYSSDSRGNWFYGDPLENLQRSNNLPIQLLTHPIWWDTKLNKDSSKRLDQFALNYIKSFCNNLAFSTEVYDNSRNLSQLEKLK